MALRYVEGFDYHTPESYLLSLPPTSGQKFRSQSYAAQNFKFTATNKRQGTGLCMTPTAAVGGTSYPNTSGLYFSTPFIAKGIKITLGVAVLMPALAVSPFFTLNGLSGSTLYSGISMNIQGDGSIAIYYLNSTTTMALMGTIPGALSAGQWSYLEFEITFNSANVTIAAYLNGTLLGNYSTSSYYGVVPSVSLLLGASNGAPNGSIPPDTWMSGAAANTIFFDDLYMIDSNGVAPVGRLGDIHIEALAPKAEVVNTNFVNTGGTSPADTLGPGSEDNSTYYSASAPGDELIVNTASTISARATNILAVAVTQLSQKTDAVTTRSMAGVVKESDTGTETVGTGVLLENSIYDYIDTVFPAVPSTGAAWTRDKVLAMGFGVRVTA